MSTIIHTSDLHFSKTEREYCLSVWEEIRNIGLEEKAEAILISGDLFNEFSDIEACRSDLQSGLENYPIPIFAISGNHEILRINRGSLGSFSLGEIHWYHSEDPKLIPIESGNWELLVVPYQSVYQNYRDWKFPEKKKPRIVMAHGIVPELLAYTGIDEEEGDHILEIDMLRKLAGDYYALGHIHKPTSKNWNGLSLHYPGSPRVWRRGESGPRSVNLIQIGRTGEISVIQRKVQSAGEYRELEWNLKPDGSIPDIAPEDSFSSNDMIQIKLIGFAESEPALAEVAKELERKWKIKFPRMQKVDLSHVEFLAGVQDEHLVRKFLAEWDQKVAEISDPKTLSLWNKARQIGVQAILDQRTGGK
jgi:predicted phosphodiesterase